MKYFLKLVVLLAFFLVGGSTYGQTPFDIVINYTGDPQFQSAFENAEAIWESILPSRIGTAPNSPTNTLTITASVSPIDGPATNPGNVLATAEPTLAFGEGGFLYATEGIAIFDSADIATLSAGGTFEAVVLHEIGHVIGFGTLWEFNNVYFDSTSETSVGQYVGPNGLAQYNQEFGLSEDFIPIENNGGPGTEDFHFDEETFGLPLNNDITVEENLGPINLGPNSGELLTGVLNGDIFISNTTGGTFQDIGFEVDFDAITAFNESVTAGSGSDAVPEPSSTAALLVASAVVFTRRRKQSLYSQQTSACQFNDELAS